MTSGKDPHDPRDPHGKDAHDQTPHDEGDLTALKAALAAATPAPDPARRAADLALARKNFAALQESRTPARPTPEPPGKGLLTGVRQMLTTLSGKSLSGKGALTLTTALVACGFLILTPQGQDLLRPLGGQPEVAETGPHTGTDIAPEPGAEPGPESGPEFRPELGAEPFSAPGADISAPLAEQAANGTLGRMAGDAAPAPDSVTDPAAGLRLEPAPETTTRTAPQSATTADAEAASDPGLAGEQGEPPVLSPLPAAPPAAPSAPPPAPAMIHSDGDAVAAPSDNTETFANATENPVRIVAEAPVSTFSIDVDTASYAVIRQSLTAGQLPPADAVRIEEMINYFPYDYNAPEGGEAPFRPTVTVLPTPWNPDTQLLHIGLQGTLPAVENRPPLNLIFLVDTSGSMAEASKLPLLKQSFRLMLDQLRPEDQVAIVEYAGSAGLVLPATSASDRDTILTALQGLGAGGGTNGQGGLEQAYAVANGMAGEGEVSRVILATDGDFNVGLSGAQDLTDFIAEKRDTGVYLSVLGFGRGNLDDATMQALAQNGNGIAAYVDSLGEAQKVLVDQLTGALFPIAGDVKVQVEFNPGQVAEYRLIGYETRALRRTDFNNDAVDAGELGAGHSVTALYEITPVGSPAQLGDPLRYGPEATAGTPSDELAFLRLRWKSPGEDVSQLLETPVLQRETGAGTEARFAVAIAGFGQLLRGDRALGDWGWDQAIALANANRGEDAFGYRTEAVQLMRLAQSLSGQ